MNMSKRLKKIPARRSHIEVIEQRKVEVEKWIADEDMDFQKTLQNLVANHATN